MRRYQWLKVRNKLLGFVGLCVIVSVGVVYADNNTNLELAKEYEGTFYNHMRVGDWYPFTDMDTVLGEPKEVKNMEDENIEYYINDSEGYVMQFESIKDFNVGFAIWKDGTLVDLSSSMY